MAGMTKRDIMQAYGAPARWRTPHVEWFYGPEGSGKTHTASYMQPSGYLISDLNRQWPGYVSQTHLVIDDVQPNMTGTEWGLFIAIMSGHPIRVTNGGKRFPLLATSIVVTSRYPPTVFTEGAALEKTMRLIHCIREFAPDSPN